MVSEDEVVDRVQSFPGGMLTRELDLQSRGTLFRIWATQTLLDFTIKGFALDDDELLEPTRDIRASERRFYLKITDTYEQCSIDYDKNAEITSTFFNTVQNKLHRAVTSKTAAELIAERAEPSKPGPGLMASPKAPTGKILKADIATAKNYLIDNEIKEIEPIVAMYLDYAENQAARQRPTRTPASRRREATHG